MPDALTVDAILAELAEVTRVQPEGGGGVTVAELAMQLRCSERIARRKLNALHIAGRLECIRMTRPAMDGRQVVVPTYRVRAAK